ncbi:GntR family transcriptional regulator [Candidatus Roseilinea sp. NK_OTU-006]|jgi:GntR family transcriptional regulator|uniref:GntR family transcriptional regulator n=1 Tax=Candidatus Roseilinea sp. NK_OTU-006 TaxID=2704250 RepID=UPI001F0B45D8|nr:GntR family transcriptional regulator [Candidatus Roseilinea sp. NK_OTU-006]
MNTWQSVPSLDKRDPTPLYCQLKEVILSQIDSGAWSPGMQLPSERELCERFGISRITVRQALAELEMEGRLVRDQGRGTFVAPPRIAQHLTRLTGFTQDMQERGKTAGSVVLQLTVTRATAAVAHRLRLDARHRQVILLQRLRTANGEPMAVETAHLSATLCRDILCEDLTNQSLYHLLSQKYGVIPTRAEQQLEAVACPLEAAKVLGVRVGSPVLHLYRTTYSQHGCPFETVESYYRGDKYVFYAELSLAAEPSG